MLFFQNRAEAAAAVMLLKERLAKFGLELAPDKTRIVPMGPLHEKEDEKFDFSGFTFYNAKTCKGKYRLGIRTSAKGLKAKLEKATE